MPTYKNETPDIISLPFPPWTIKPDQELEFVKALSSSDVTALGLTKTADTPYVPLAIGVISISFAGAEDQSASGLYDAKVIRITTDVDVEIRAELKANTYYYPLNADSSVDIVNDGDFDVLILTSGGAGSATVILLPE